MSTMKPWVSQVSWVAFFCFFSRQQSRWLAGGGQRYGKERLPLSRILLCLPRSRARMVAALALAVFVVQAPWGCGRAWCCANSLATTLHGLLGFFRRHRFISLAVRKGKAARSQYKVGGHATGPDVQAWAPLEPGDRPPAQPGRPVEPLPDVRRLGGVVLREAN